MSPRKQTEKRTAAPPGKLRDYWRKRDFSRTPEPSGDEEASPAARPKGGSLEFVIQKHAASHLHFDFRLELDGAMKSWAVPKGPSLDPSQRRLAMEVEDHPMAYNSFEGTIPKGEYGGGTVMLWDRGKYTADGADGDPVASLRAGYRKGDLKIWLDGERLRGAWVLRRIKPAPGGGSGERAQWLLIKRHDEFTEPGSDVVATHDTSVVSGRTMEEIASGKSKVWRSNRPARRGARSAVRGPRDTLGTPSPRTAHRAGTREAGGRTESISAALQPMLASIGDAVPKGDGWTFEPKYDGIRVLAYMTPGAPPAVTLVTRNQKDKSKQFPEVVEALARLATQVRRPIVIDGEIVAVDPEGKPVRFQALQSRMHVTRREMITGHATDTPSALYAFDILLDGDDVLVREPWSARRARLERVLRNRTTPRLRLAESIPNDGERMVEHAREQGWEGVIAKRMTSRYEAGVRSRAWLKLKVEWRQEFVVGGWTEPRNSRQHLGALLLGYYDGDRFVYVGHTGGGMDGNALRDMAARLTPLERKTSPFATPIKTNERAHWVEPQVVVEVKFSQWTADAKLRHPIFLGIREDKNPRDVRLEGESVQGAAGYGLRAAGSTPRAASPPQSAARGRKGPAARSPQPAADDILDQLDAIEGDGVLTIDGASLEVTNLRKVFFPEDGLTKGDLMRYYTRMARYVLPVVADRPLVLKRYPNGIHGKAFYQQRAPDDVPPGVRVEIVRNDEGEEMPRIIGGDLLTLLWTVQLGAVSVDPWLSRVQTCDDADFAVIDLDPGPEATFRRVIDVARWTKEELDELGLRAAIKTSGATGLHVCLPLPPQSSYETAQTLAQLVASRVAEHHPDEATLERSVKARPADSVYVDYLQNIRGKTVAGAYAARARPGATVSTPLDWSELTDDLDPRAVTIDTVPERVARVGDLWATAMRRVNTLATLRRVAEGKRVRRRASVK